MRHRHRVGGGHLEQLLHLVANADDVHLRANVGQVVEDGPLPCAHVLVVAGVVFLLDVNHPRLAALGDADLEGIDGVLVVQAIRDDDQLLLAKVWALNDLLDLADEVGAARGFGHGRDAVEAGQRLDRGERQLELALLAAHRPGAIEDARLALGVTLVRRGGVGRGQIDVAVKGLE